MTYEAPRPVAHNRAFEAIAPLLWLRAGSQGRRIEKARHDFDVAGHIRRAVRPRRDAGLPRRCWRGRIGAHCVHRHRRRPGVQMVCGELPARVEAVRLYESYVTNFTINTGRE